MEKLLLLLLVYYYYYCESNKEQVNKLCGQNVDLLLLNISVYTVTVCLYNVAPRNIHAYFEKDTKCAEFITVNQACLHDRSRIASS